MSGGGGHGLSGGHAMDFGWWGDRDLAAAPGAWEAHVISFLDAVLHP